MIDFFISWLFLGEINFFFIWQQFYLMFFVEIDYFFYFNNFIIFQKWDVILIEMVNFMVDFVWFNFFIKVYDFGFLLYFVLENINFNIIFNFIFEFVYWRFGFDVVMKWKVRLNQMLLEIWGIVRDNLVFLLVVNNIYVIYEGILNMWIVVEIMFDYFVQVGIFGFFFLLLQVDFMVVNNMVCKIKEMWRLNESYGWDFVMLVMNFLRLGDVEQVVEYLFYFIFKFDDVGYVVGGERVFILYFFNSVGLLMVVGMMVGGWVDDEGVKLFE